MNLVFIGVPGVGKGTYASKIVKKYKLFPVSPGELLRENVRDKPELVKKGYFKMEAGDLLDDDLVIGVIKKAIGRKTNVLFDGFPRTVYQAKQLDEFAKPELIINFVADEKVIIGRLSNRRVCPKCEAIYNLITNSSKKKGVCDNCNTRLIQRKDDLPAAIKERLKVFNKITLPVIDFYKKRAEFKVVDASSDDIGSVVDVVIEIIENL